MMANRTGYSKLCFTGSRRTCLTVPLKRWHPVSQFILSERRASAFEFSFCLFLSRFTFLWGTDVSPPGFLLREWKNRLRVCNVHRRTRSIDKRTASRDVCKAAQRRAAAQANPPPTGADMAPACKVGGLYLGLHFTIQILSLRLRQWQLQCTTGEVKTVVGAA